MRKESTYIYSIEGKDIINGGVNGYKIKPNKKFKGSLDYSIETIQLDKIAEDRNEELFYINNDKQYTKAIINLTFQYTVKEYHEQNINKQKIYVMYKYIGNAEDIKFTNGIYVVDNEFLVIMVNKEIQIENNEFMDLLLDRQIDLPKGFDFYTTNDNKVVFVVHDDLLRTIKGTEDIRKYLYINGFKIIDGDIDTSYVRFKRSSGSSRDGKCLFIRKDYFDDMMNWSYMGLDYLDTNKIDLAAMESYVSLTSSGIIDTIEIDPISILLIDDYKSILKDSVMVTRIVKIDNKDRLQTQLEENLEIKNNIWDGQSLLDVSIFGEMATDKKKHQEYADKGYLLLRNRFFKSACFNTNIQKFFKDNDITSIDQLNGKTLATDIRDIKLITTPSSIKYLKFGSWEDFISQCSSTWGVVKFDKPTHFFNGDMVQTHYQLLNTIQLSEDEVKEFLKPSLDYMRLLKNDISVFRNHLHIKIKENIETGEINSTNELMLAMLQVNNQFLNTDLFVSYKQDIIERFINNIQKGHVLVPGNYSVLCGNGFEMLKATIKDKKHSMYFDKDKPESVLGIDEIYCTNFNYNTKLLCCRSPHVSMSGLWIPNNIECIELEEYFNSSPQIVHINSIGNNILNRLSGCDFDSDQILITPLLTENSGKNYKYFKVPMFGEKPEKTFRYNTLEEKADLDIKTSINIIGEIINFSQVLNSELWHRVNNDEDINGKEIEEIYTDICQLDVMSRIEIDMAKKEFTINNPLELKILKEKYNILKPKFLQTISKNKGYKPKANKHEERKTTMDYLNKILKKELKTIRAKRRNSKGNPVVAFDKLLSQNKDIKISDADYHQIENIKEKCIKLKKECDKIWSNDNLESEEKYIKTNQLKNILIDKMSKLKISQATIKKIVNDFAKNPDKIIQKENKEKNQKKFTLKSIEKKLLSILFEAHMDKFISIFEQNRVEIETLKRVKKVPEGYKSVRIYDMDYIYQK